MLTFDWKENAFQLVLLLRIEEWLHARFAEAAPEPVEEGQTSEFAELKEEMLKNKKRIKSMMAMLEAQSKLLKNLAVAVDPKFKLPQDVDEWVVYRGYRSVKPV